MLTARTATTSPWLACSSPRRYYGDQHGSCGNTSRRLNKDCHWHFTNEKRDALGFDAKDQMLVVRWCVENAIRVTKERFIDSCQGCW